MVVKLKPLPRKDTVINGKLYCHGLCKRRKPVDTFTVCSKGRRGYYRWCRACRRVDNQEYEGRPEVKEARRIRDQQRQRLYPSQMACRRATRRAIELGYLKVPDFCERCHCKPDTSLQTHHFNYIQPLNVTFVCKPCHGILDREQPGINKDAPYNPENYLLECDLIKAVDNLFPDLRYYKK